MKAKVFKYRSDGNTVVAPYMELEPYAENVYLSLSRKNEYGNEDDDCFHVVCRIENVYFSSGQYSRRFLNGENRRDETAAYCRNWIADTLQGAERGAFVRLISYNSDKQGTGPVIGTSRLQAYGNRYRQKNPENFLCFPSWVAHQRKRGLVLPHRTATGQFRTGAFCGMRYQRR